MGRVTSQLGRLGEPGDILDPRSRHNIHVTHEDDLAAIGPWSSETLYMAVRRADNKEWVVVLDYDRRELYLAASTDLTYEPPQGFGFTSVPALHVDEPHRIVHTQQQTTSIDPVIVSPEFDILVPAFDWQELSDDDVLPPIDHQSSGTPARSGTGTPS